MNRLYSFIFFLLSFGIFNQATAQVRVVDTIQIKTGDYVILFEDGSHRTWSLLPKSFIEKAQPQLSQSHIDSVLNTASQPIIEDKTSGLPFETGGIKPEKPIESGGPPIPANEIPQQIKTSPETKVSNDTDIAKIEEATGNSEPVKLSRKDIIQKYGRTVYYQERYDAECLQHKITDNKGEGFNSLYGTRNMRPILHGVVYRGGANNYYHKYHRRDNRNPLPDDGLINLGEEGFSKSIYLYRENFEKAIEQLYFPDEEHRIHYSQNLLNTQNDVYEMLKNVQEVISNDEHGPIYLHCWNGWHQSGYAAAVILKQFCGINNTQAVQYWNDGTDGNNKGYNRIKNAIREFSPYSNLKISEPKQAEICPCLHQTETGQMAGQESFRPPEDMFLGDAQKEVLEANEYSSPPAITRVSTPAYDFLETSRSNWILKNVSFASSSSILNSESKRVLNQFINFLKRHNYINIEIGGYTDSSGPVEQNLTLSQERAKSVYQYLKSEGIRAEKLTFKGYGITDPIGSNVTAQGKKKNRRTEFKITEVNIDVKFKVGSALIVSESKKTLDKLTEILVSNPKLKIEIAGHTDNSGDPEFNLRLSERRAKAVFDYLVRKGAHEPSLSHKGYGDKRPLVPNDSEKNRAVNRRTEFNVLSNL